MLIIILSQTVKSSPPTDDRQTDRQTDRVYVVVTNRVVQVVVVELRVSETRRSIYGHLTEILVGILAVSVTYTAAGRDVRFVYL